MVNYEHFELRRMSDDLIYQFDRKQMPDGQIGYQRRDADLWIVFRPDWAGLPTSKTIKAWREDPGISSPKIKVIIRPQENGLAKKVANHTSTNSNTARLFDHHPHQPGLATVGDV